jgi:hypothetical protein
MKDKDQAPLSADVNCEYPDPVQPVLASDAASQQTSHAMTPDGTLPVGQLPPAMLRYMENEARRRGVSLAEVYKEISEVEADVNGIMPALKDIITPLPAAWLDDVAWDDCDR